MLREANLRNVWISDFIESIMREPTAFGPFDFLLRVNGWTTSLIALTAEEPACSFDPAVYEAGTLPRCAVKHRRLVGFTMMGIYLLFANVMLLNILIAMFRCFHNAFVLLLSKLELCKLKLLISKLFLLEKK